MHNLKMEYYTLKCEEDVQADLDATLGIANLMGYDVALRMMVYNIDHNHTYELQFNSQEESFSIKIATDNNVVRNVVRNYVNGKFRNEVFGSMKEMLDEVNRTL